MDSLEKDMMDWVQCYISNKEAAQSLSRFTAMEARNYARKKVAVGIVIGIVFTLISLRYFA